MSKKTGLKKWTPENQDHNAWTYAQERYKISTKGGDLLADLKAGVDPSHALNRVWTSLSGGAEQNKAGASFLPRYRKLAADYTGAKPKTDDPIRAAINDVTPNLRNDEYDKAIKRQLDVGPGKAVTFDSAALKRQLDAGQGKAIAHDNDALKRPLDASQGKAISFDNDALKHQLDAGQVKTITGNNDNDNDTGPVKAVRRDVNPVKAVPFDSDALKRQLDTSPGKAISFDGDAIPGKIVTRDSDALKRQIDVSPVKAVPRDGDAFKRQLDASPGKAISFDSDVKKAVGPNPDDAPKAPDRVSEVGPRAPARLAANGAAARVTIYNNTGGNAIVSAGMAAA